MTSSWSEPVIFTHRDKRIRVLSAEEAEGWLRDHSQVFQGPVIEEAQRSVAAAARGEGSLDEARNAFVAALRTSGLEA